MHREHVPIVSTGRGGAGNIGNDVNVYTDGAIIREGPEGESADAEPLSTGRGGAGNIGTGSGSGAVDAVAGTTAQSRGTSRVRAVEDDYVPEPAMRQDDYPNFHTGRGGGGNVHMKKYGGHSSAGEQRADRSETVGDKIKHALGMGHKARHEDGAE